MTAEEPFEYRTPLDELREARAEIERLYAEIAMLRQTVNDQAAVIERLTREHEDPHHGLGRAGMKAAELLPELAVIRHVMKEAP